MTVRELVEKALSDPTSLIDETLFYVISVHSDSIRLQGEITGNLLRILPSHILNKLSLEGQHLVADEIKTTVELKSNPDECYELDICLTPYEVVK